MGASLSRLGDKNSGGGAILRGASTVLCNGKPVGLHVSPISPHQPKTPKHKKSVSTSGSPSVVCEGSPVLRVGSSNSCGHSIVTGSKDTVVA